MGGVVKESLLDVIQVHVQMVQRKRTVSGTRVIVNVSAMDTSAVTRGHTLWNKW